MSLVCCSALQACMLHPQAIQPKYQGTGVSASLLQSSSLQDTFDQCTLDAACL